MSNKLEYAETITSSSRWQELIDDSTLLYATWEWGSVCEDFGHDRRYLGITEGDELVAGLPLMFIDTRLFGKKLVSMPYAPYGSLLVSDDVDSPDEYRKQLLGDLQHLSDELGVAQASVRGVDFNSVPAAYERVNRFVTFEVDLTDGEDEVWDNVASRFRRSVRKSRKEDVYVEKGYDETMLSEYYDLYLDNMQYYGTPPYSRQFFRNVSEHLAKIDAFEMYMAYTPEGKPINGVTTFSFGDRAIYWTGVSDYEYRDLNGGSRLMWEAIADSCESGYSTFDLGRTREDTGVYDYKKGIGKPVDLVDVHYAPTGELSLTNPEDEKYDKYKQLWQKLPTKMTECIGPHIRKRLSL